MKNRLRLIQRIRPLDRMRQRTTLHWSTLVMGALVFNLFILLYSYLNLGVQEKAKALTISTMSASNGNWTSASTWSAGRVPQDGDTLTIPAGKTVTVDIVTQSYNHLLIVVNGTLFFNGGKKIIMCEGMVIVNSGGLLSAANGGSKFEICGSFLWDGNSPGDGPLTFGSFTTVLPVDLVYFKAAPENKNVTLNWETASQVNCDYFSIERSTDGSDFSPIINIKGEGNSSQRDVYNYVDNNAPEGISYYRLTEVDFDGTSQTFNTVSVNIKPKADITVYPNPVPAGGTANVEIPFEDGSSSVEVSMVNIEGKKIFSKTFEKNSDSRNLITFQTETFPAKGTFLLIVSGLNNKTVKKIIVI